LQEWLIGHYVCSRHQEHKIANLVWMNSQVPPRSEGVKLKMDNYPVMAFWGGIGGLSWSLPYVNFIDLFGLNDRVIARSPAVSNSTRRMAHDRIAPGGYVDCFKPNVELNPRGGIRVIPRPSPLTSDEITNCETKWWDLIDSK
ncbi:MAG: hypothetical protein GY780_07835, partial [bacterium]|nr:hypothetical protein [bacterium]